MKLIEITGENFQDEVAGSELPVLLDFWAAWCGPCRALIPVPEEIAADYDGRLRVGKVDVDAEPQLAAAFRVSGIPMLTLVRDRKVVAVKVGAAPLRAIEAELGLSDLPARAVA